jgi:arylsulfatase A-like enzyme
VPTPSARPNILFVTTDQQHPQCMGFLDPRLKTPHIDRLAREGAVLTRSYTCSPVCTPTRATWVTGQYPSTHGAWSVGVNLPEPCVSLPELLGHSGYRTAMIGKSHLQACLTPGTSAESPPRSEDTAFHRGWHGPWYGFEHAEINVGHADERHSASMHYRAWLEDHGVDINRHFACTDWMTAQAWSLPEQYHPCAWAAERAVAYLRTHANAHAGSPFYLNLNFPEPHGPMHVPEPWYSLYADTPLHAPTRRWREWDGKPTMFSALCEDGLDKLDWYDRFRMPGIELAESARKQGPASEKAYTPLEIGRWRGYFGMISLLDHHLGRVLSCLDELGMSDNTLVVFTSDHGDLMGDHYIFGKGPCHYDGCVRVPTVVRYPRQIAAGSRCDELVSNVDLAPTFMAAAGLPIDPRMQGIDQLATWSGRAGPRRQGVWVDYRTERGLYVNTWITQRHRLSVHATSNRGDEYELYDLEADPNEFENLASRPEHSSIVTRMMGEMLREATTTAYPWAPRLGFA